MSDNMINRDPWLPDDPIKDGAEDTLGRSPFARRVAAIIDDAGTLPSSVVVGLTGPWGSGKSSTVNLAIDYLDRKRWEIREVNPWGLSGAEAVVGEVLAAIASALPGQTAKHAREAISKYATLASPLLSALPFAGDLTAKLVDLAASRIAGDATLAGQAEKVTDALTKLGQPVLIVIDDMDRLQPPELLALFKAIRLLGRLPHVHYLVSYDQRTVLELIAATPIAHDNLDRAGAFMEKIVTIRMDQPPTRVEQAESLYDARMRDLLTRLNVAHLTQEQQRRLETDHRQLLRRTLAEPRSIGRFFTQLYAYLPLVGVNDVDLPDFIAMTLLRTQFPRLYAALSQDRHLLVGSTIASWESPIGDWRDLDATVGALTDVPALRAQTIETLTLIFPRLSPDYTFAAAVDVQRKRGRRASDEDYVDRYFALMLPDDDISDTHLASALNEWVQDAPGEHVQRLRRALLPADSTAASYAATDRILRRCESESSSYPPDVSALIVGAATELFRELPDPNLAAAQNWVTMLLGRSSPIPLEPLLDKVMAPTGERSTLWPLIQAVTRAASIRAASTEVSDSWLTAAARDLGSTAWTRFIDQAALGDTAPSEPALGYLLHAEETYGRDDISARLRDAVDTGRVRAVDLAARFVNIGNYLNDYRQFITEFDPAELYNRIGWDRVLGAHRDVQQGRIEAAYNTIDLYDITWTSLRRYASQRLALAEAPESTSPPLTEAADDIVNEVSNRTAPAITGATQPELLLTITVWASATTVNRNPLTDDQFDTASTTWVTDLAQQGITAWLDGHTDLWHTPAPTWQKTESDGQRSQQAQAELTQLSRSTAHPPDNAAAGHLIAAAAARVDFTPYPVDTGQRFTRLLTIEAGFWLAKLDADYRHVSSATTDRPNPAALTLAQVREVLTILAADAMNPRLRYAAADHTETDLVLAATINTTTGIDAVLNLTDAVRETNRSSNQATFVIETPARDTYTDRQKRAAVDPDRLAVTVLQRWLRANGYRHYDHLLNPDAT